MKVDDIVRLDTGKRIRVFRVLGVYLGSDREEDVIGIECLDMRPASPDGIVTREMLVPRHIMELVVCNEKRQVPMPLDVTKRVYPSNDSGQPERGTKR